MADPRATAPAYPPGALPIGTRLGEFEVRRVLGVGGFGIVYLAFDHLLEREVALKEYMPSALAERNETMHVSLVSQANADTFALGLRSFVNEARLLARFDHPSLVKVHRFWEANGTAYMAMALYKGRTVRDVRLGMSVTPDEAWVRRILEPLLGAVEKLHSEDVFHRDIAPDNILIEADGRPVLLDFGAARRVISDRSQALTAILKPSYAPIEQYADVQGMKQGAWTDIYALGATMHFLLLGKPPPPAPGRSIQDTMPPLASQPLTGCSREFLELVDWMLRPLPTERPQSVAAVRDVLEGRAQVPRSAAATPDIDLGVDEDATIVVPRGQTGMPSRGEEATVIVPRGGHTGYGPAQSAPPPSPPKPPVADEDATVVTAYGSDPSGRRPASPPQMPMPPMQTSVPSRPATPPSAPPTRAAERTIHVPPPAPPRPAPASTARSALVPVLAGVVVAGAIGGGLWWFLTRPTVPAVTATAPAASVAPAAPEPAPAPVAAPAPPVAAPAAAPAPLPTLPLVTEPAPAPAPSPKATTPPAPRPAPARPVTSMPTEPPPQPRPVEPAPPRPAAPASVAAPPPVPAPAPPVAAAPAPDGPRSPSERCAKELPLVRLICIDLACNRSEFAKHPECVKLRAEQANKRYLEGN